MVEEIKEEVKIEDCEVIVAKLPDEEVVDLTIPIFSRQKMLSPTSINQYFKCPRAYFYQYICKLKIKPNINMIKGNIVHKALELFFKEYPADGDLESHLLNSYSTAVESQRNPLKYLDLSEEEITIQKMDCVNMLLDYLTMLKRKIHNYKAAGKAENDGHAFFLLRPKFSEMSVKSDELHTRGVIDRVNVDFDGLITLVDYKTSVKYGVGLPIDYKRQLSIYTLLYQEQEKKTADFVAVSFLRIGEEYLLEVTPSLLRYARDVMLDTWQKTTSTAIDDYPLIEGNLCRWCDFKDVCSGKEDWLAKVREQRLYDLVKAKRKESDKDDNEIKAL